MKVRLFIMKKILSLILLCLTGMAYGQTIGYLRYDTVKVMKNGGRGSLDVTGSVRFTGLLAKSASTDSVIVRDSNGYLGTTAKSAFGTPSWALLGNSGTTAATNFIGTTDSVDFVIKTKSLERFRVNARGALGLGTGTDYGSSGYLLKSNGASTAPSWVDPTSYLATIYNSNGVVTDTDRYIDATVDDAGNLYFGKLARFNSMQLFASRFEIFGNSSANMYGNDSVSIAAPLIHLQDSSLGSAVNGYVWTLVDENDGEGTWKPASGGSGSPAGSNTQIQFNDGGSFGADAGLVFNKASGSVGIGTAPSFLLDVRGAGTSEHINIQGSGTGSIKIGTIGGTGEFGAMWAAQASPTVSNYAFLGNASFSIFNVPSGGSINFRVNNADQMVISSAGALRLNAYGAGTLVTDGSGNVTATSDMNVKHSISPFRLGLNEIMNVTPSNYIRNSDATNSIETGFIAQNIRDAFGGFGVGKDINGNLTLNNNVILAAAVNAIQELKRKNDDLQAQITELKNKK